MLKKILLSGLFALVTLGFFLGFVSYQREIREALSKSIDMPIVEDENTPTEEESSQKETLVPRIIGLSEKEAEKLLKDAGLLPSPVTEHTDQVEKGYVFYQRPMEGTKILEGEEVIYSVSAGPFGQEVPDEVQEDKEVLLPSLLGKSQREGEELLKELGLVVRVRRDYSDDAAAGIIMEQVPHQNSRLTSGEEVTLWVSLGRKIEETKAKIPSVLGKTRGEAETILKGAGYQVSVTEREDTDANVGRVLSQSPAAGTEVVEKGRIQLVIGKKKAVSAPPENSPGDTGSEEPGIGEAPEEPVETSVEPPQEEEPVEPVQSGNN